MRWDVVVVGGGVAGLAAADQLSRAGKRVLLLEARSRLGGRVHTIIDPTHNHPIELGAEFLEGDAKEVRDITREAGLEFQEIAERHEKGRSGDKRAVPDAEDLIDRLLGGAASPTRDVPVAQLIREQAHRFRPDELELMTMYLEGFHAADLERYGTGALAENHQAEETDREQMRRIVGGYGRVVRHLQLRLEVAHAEVRTGSEVSRLCWRPGRVELTVRSDTGSQAIEATQTIVTVPISLLRRGEPQLDPMPPRWESALAALETGPAQRIDLRFDRAWWIEPDRRPPIFVHGKREAFPVWWTTSPPTLPYLTGWAGGPRAASLANLGQQELVERGLASLSSIFGLSTATLAQSLQAAYTYDWTSDPYSRGAYSYGGIGAAAARESLRQPVAGTLFLAGEALAAEGRNGTVPGALSSGLRAAASVLGAVAAA